MGWGSFKTDKNIIFLSQSGNEFESWPQAYLCMFIGLFLIDEHNLKRQHSPLQISALPKSLLYCQSSLSWILSYFIVGVITCSRGNNMFVISVVFCGCEGKHFQFCFESSLFFRDTASTNDGKGKGFFLVFLG